jgi:uncharacterized protein (DUF849 family)
MVKKRCDIVLCLTTGGPKRATVDERVRVVSTFEPELASLNTGSLNFALFPMAEGGWEFEYDWEKQYLEDSEDYIFVNTFKTLREFLHIFGKAQTKPELEIYDAGMIDNVVYLLERGLLKRPIYLQFVLGILGGMAATPNNLMFLYSRARETIGDFTWSVCAAGRHQIPLCTTALVLGGNVRVGLEDSMYVGRGVLATSNADQVEKIIRIARELSLEPATPSDAREMLGLKGLDQVNW